MPLTEIPVAAEQNKKWGTENIIGHSIFTRTSSELFQGFLSSYLIRDFTVNNQVHSINTRYTKFNVVCPKYMRETEGVESFLVTASKLSRKFSL